MGFFSVLLLLGFASSSPTSSSNTLKLILSRQTTSSNSTNSTNVVAVNLTTITSGFCGTSGACNLLVSQPPPSPSPIPIYN
ncbi:hypothetical protein D9757_010792 [Collybiopsis confluens]|uniref:Uncharacterized protein n=1 Tax=Collybiopsis confluens TaxID=2823264 RepID=A0A8H5GU77_9AGAR|nr:hypothetical protein D9757_010792 [Collybiopsis confluens]